MGQIDRVIEKFKQLGYKDQASGITITLSMAETIKREVEQLEAENKQLRRWLRPKEIGLDSINQAESGVYVLKSGTYPKDKVDELIEATTNLLKYGTDEQRVEAALTTLANLQGEK